MSKVTELAAGQIAATETITVELIETNETPVMVIMRWPVMRLIHPYRFGTAADMRARMFAAAAVQLSDQAAASMSQDTKGSVIERPSSSASTAKLF
jgi:hypothetical protein